MLNKGILEIINLNNEFYEKHAESFDRSREFYWEGFKNALKYLKNGHSVLDLGCGNARFLKFLKENQQDIKYFGVDSNHKFIEDNKIKYPEAKFNQVDIIGNPNFFDHKKYNLIVVFGVTHHIPNKEYRINWIKNLTKYLNPEGILYISFWNFDISKDDKNFHPIEYTREKGDYFLGWKGDYSTHRFCHFFDNEEIEEIKKYLVESGLKVSFIEEFQKEDNRYLIIKKTDEAEV